MNKKVKNKSFSHYSFFPKNRKGTHVEVIISFVIFIVFVVFLLAVSRPSISKQKDNSNLLDKIKYNLIEDLSSDVTVVSITVLSSAETCLTLDHSISDLGIGERIVVENSSGKIIDNARVSSSGDYITIDGLTPEETFFKIYSSEDEEFASNIPNGLPCNPAGESIGLTKTDSYVLQEKILTTIATGNYEDLKTRLDLSEDVDFTFGIILSNGTLIEKTHEDLESKISTDVFAKDFPIKYIDLNGNINFGYLKIKVW